MNKSSIGRRYGYKRDLADQRDFKFDKLLPPENLPAQYLGLKPFLPPVISQLSIGMCSGCGTSRALKTLLNSVNYKWAFTPSALGIYAMTRQEEGTSLSDDSGASISDVFKVINSQGVIPEDSNPEWSWPFSASDGRWAQMPPPKCLKDAGLHKVVKYSRVDQTEQAIKSVLCQNLPIVIGISVYDSFESSSVAQTGMIPMPGFLEQLLGGHCLWLYGYGEVDANHADGQNSWGCYDDRTEVLTSRGWQFFKDVSNFDTIATLNPDTHELEYKPILEKHKFPYEGDLYKYHSDYVDLLVTPNHKMYVQGKERQMPWKMIEAENITQKQLHFKKNAKWNGLEIESMQIGEYIIPMDLWLEFLGYFLSEGHTSHRAFARPERIRIRKYQAGDSVQRDVETGRYIKGKTNVAAKVYTVIENACTQENWIIGISQIKPKNLNTIQKCLDKLPFRFTRSGHTWTTNNKALFESLKSFGKQSTRFIPKDILKLSNRQLRILFNALMLGDGSYSMSKTGERAIYYTSSKRLADDVQELALKIDYAADIGITDRRGTKTSKGYNYNELEYVVKLKRKRLEPSYNHGSIKESYTGFVYCLTVSNHLMYVRRNGKAVWCGNSDWGDKGHFHIPFDYLTNPNLTSDLWVPELLT